MHDKNGHINQAKNLKERFMKGTHGVKEYLLKYRGRFLLTGLLVFLLHGKKLTSGIIGIDTEDLIRLQESFYDGWLHTGRQGLVFLKHLFGNTQFNPYYTGIMTLLLFSVSVCAFLLLWDSVCFGGGFFRQNPAAEKNAGSRKRKAQAEKASGSRDAKTWEGRAGGMWVWFFGGLLWVSHPVWAEQFYFSLQSMEIGMALFLTALALYLSFRWTGSRRPVYAAAGAGCLILVFSTYQSFVVLYIFGVVSILLLQVLREASGEEEPKVSLLWKRVFSYCAVFFAAFLLNTLITKLFFGSSDYLQNQIYWGRASVKDCIHAIGGHVIKVFTGYHSVFYQAGFGVLALFDLILLGIFLGRKKKGKAVILFFYLALLATPFLMTLVLGGAPAARSQLTLPAVTAFLGYLSMLLIKLLTGGFSVSGGKEVFRGVLTVCGGFLCLVCGTEQAKITESLYYTDACRYEQDAALGRELIWRLDEAGGNERELPVIVIGGMEFEGSHSCIAGEVIGRSFFHYDVEVEPKYFWSTRRILGFLHTLGADYDQASPQMLEKALEYVQDMPEWPSEESVQERDGMIIVKLRE